MEDAGKESGEDLVMEVLAICRGMEKRYWILEAWAGTGIAEGSSRPVLETDWEDVGAGKVGQLAERLAKTYNPL